MALAKMVRLAASLAGSLEREVAAMDASLGALLMRAASLVIDPFANLLTRCRVGRGSRPSISLCHRVGLASRGGPGLRLGRRSLLPCLLRGAAHGYSRGFHGHRRSGARDQQASVLNPLMGFRPGSFKESRGPGQLSASTCEFDGLGTKSLLCRQDIVVDRVFLEAVDDAVDLLLSVVNVATDLHPVYIPDLGGARTSILRNVVKTSAEGPCVAEDVEQLHECT